MSEFTPMYIHLRQMETLRDFSFMFGCPIELLEQLPTHELRVRLLTDVYENHTDKLGSTNPFLRPILVHVDGKLCEYPKKHPERFRL